MKDKEDIKLLCLEKVGKILLVDYCLVLLNVQCCFMLCLVFLVGVLFMLLGCDLQDNDSVDKVLWVMLCWNDWVQVLLFWGQKLVLIYVVSQIINLFFFNVFYDEFNVFDIDGSDWKLEVLGLVSDKCSWILECLCVLLQVVQIMCYICIEGWSVIGQWLGVLLSLFLQVVGVDFMVKYVGFKCVDWYYFSLDMFMVLYLQIILVLDFGKEVLFM